MSEVTFEQLQQQVKGLTAQLEAHKQVVNENLHSIISLKTNIYLYQQAHQEACKLNGELQKEVERGKLQIADFAKKIAELETQLPAPQPEVDAA